MDWQSDNSFLKFNNGYKAKFSNFKEIKEEDLKNADEKTKKLFNIFAGKDHVLQADEAKKLWSKLTTAAASNKNGNNSIFDNTEMQTFLNNDNQIKESGTQFSLDNLSSLIQQVFTTSKAEEVQKAKQTDSTTSKPATNANQFVEKESIECTPQEVQNITVQTLSDDVQEARKLYETQNAQQGAVSDLVTDAKEALDTEYASSRVNRYIKKEELSVELLNKANSKEGLTQKEYLETKIDYVLDTIQDLNQYELKTGISKDSISISLHSLTFGLVGEEKSRTSQELEIQKSELKKLRSILESLTPEEINALTSQVANIKANPQNPASFDLTFSGKNNKLKEQTITQGISGDRNRMIISKPEYSVQPSKGSLKSMTNNVEAYKKMTFEETFKAERGVDYNPDAIMDYTEKDTYMQFVLGMHNKKAQIDDLLKESDFLKQSEIQTSGPSSKETQANAHNLMNNLTTALKSTYGNDTEKIQQFLDETFPETKNSKFGSLYKKPEIITNEKGEFIALKFDDSQKISTTTDANGNKISFAAPNFNTPIDGQAIKSMIHMADTLKSNINTQYEKALQGKSIEDIAKETSEAYTKAFGSGDSQAMAKAYVQSQKEGIETVKGVVNGTGMLVMIAGQLIPVGGQVAAAMTMGGLATSTLGSSAVSATELLTQEKKVTKQDLQDLAQELSTNVALTASGMQIGKLSGGVYNYLAIAKQCPKLVAMSAEIGTDATMSLVADLALTGQIDLSGEGIAQLQSILVGVIHSKGNLKTFMNNHAGSSASKVDDLTAQAKNYSSKVNDLAPKAEKATSLTSTVKNSEAETTLPKTNTAYAIKPESLNTNTQTKIETGKIQNNDIKTSDNLTINEDNIILSDNINTKITEENIDGDPTIQKQQVSQATATNVYKPARNPNIPLKKYTYVSNNKEYSFLAPANAQPKELKYLIYLDSNRRKVSQITPKFDKISPNTQIQFVQECLKDLPKSNQLLEILMTTHNEAELKNILQNKDLLNKKINDAKELEQYFKRSQFAVLDGVLDIKEKDPVKYERIASSGLFELIRDNKVSVEALKQIGLHSDLTPQMYDDLAKVKAGESIVPEFAEGTDIKTAFAQTKLGDAVEIGDKMYLNDGKNLVEWNMSKEKYLELFPPVERFATVQGRLGDCYLIQTQSNAMINPKARVEFLKSFSQQGNDIVVTVKGYENYFGSNTFKDGNIKLSSNYKHCIGCKGMQMYEQTYAKVALKSNDAVDYPDTASIDNLMDRANGGQAAQTMAEVFGQGHISDVIQTQIKYSNNQIYPNSSFSSISTNTVPVITPNGQKGLANINKQPSERAKILVLDQYFKNFPNKAIALTRLEPDTTETILNHVANDNNYLVSLGTKPKENAPTESSLLSEYHLISDHAYAILGYDKNTKMVKICNPHSAAAVTEIPLEKLQPFLGHIDIIKL